MLQTEIETKLSQYIDPDLGTDYLTAKMLKRLNVTEHEIQVDIVLGFPCQRSQQAKLRDLNAWLAPYCNEKALNIQLLTEIQTHRGNPSLPAFPHIKNMIAIASGKGGVGKSMVAVNLAIALANEGAAVGLLDADIYGPSQPTMLGALGEKPILNNGKLQPIKRHGIQSMSIGYLIDDHAPMVWRGPMLGKAMQQLLQDTAWDSLDYLIIDLPPGTGDIQLTLCQKMPVTGALIVTTPQDLALIDVKRACEMFNKLNVPILGVIENMSYFQCENCGHETHLFGEGGGDKLAQQYEVALLGKIPLNSRIREMTDHGTPFAIEAQQAEIFYDIAREMTAKLSLQPKNYSDKFPKIVVQNG